MAIAFVSYEIAFCAHEEEVVIECYLHLSRQHRRSGRVEHELLWLSM